MYARGKNQFKGWYEDFKATVLKKAAKLHDFTRGTYEKIVDEVAADYRGIKGIDSGELQGAINDLKARWRTVRRQFMEAREIE